MGFKHIRSLCHCVALSHSPVGTSVSIYMKNKKYFAALAKCGLPAHYHVCALAALKHPCRDTRQQSETESQDEPVLKSPRTLQSFTVAELSLHPEVSSVNVLLCNHKGLTPMSAG